MDRHVDDDSYDDVDSYDDSYDNDDDNGDSYDNDDDNSYYNSYDDGDCNDDVDEYKMSADHSLPLASIWSHCSLKNNVYTFLPIWLCDDDNDHEYNDDDDQYNDDDEYNDDDVDEYNDDNDDEYNDDDDQYNDDDCWKMMMMEYDG